MLNTLNLLFLTKIGGLIFLKKGLMDLCLLIKSSVKLPVLALGGCGNWQHMLDAFNETNIDAVCTQNIFHFTEESIRSSKIFLDNNNINVRKLK